MDPRVSRKMTKYNKTKQKVAPRGNIDHNKNKIDVVVGEKLKFSGSGLIAVFLVAVIAIFAIWVIFSPSPRKGQDLPSIQSTDHVSATGAASATGENSIAIGVNYGNITRESNK